MYASLFLTLSFFVYFAVQAMEKNISNVLVNYYGDTITSVQALLPDDVQRHFIDTYIVKGRELWRVQKILECISEVKSAQFNKDGPKIVTACNDNNARVLNAETQQVISCFEHSRRVNSAQFNKDGTKIVTACNDHNARLWNVETQQVISCFQHNRWVNSAEFNKDDTKILTACNDGNARIWKIEAQQVISCLEHSDWVMSAQFNKDNTKILTACNDGNARIWKIEIQHVISCLEHSDRVLSAQFNKDETKIVTTCDDHNVRVWKKLNMKWSLEQILLWKLLCTWLLVEKPNKTITSTEQFIKKIALDLKDTDNELVNIWDTFNHDVQGALSHKINILIQKYGK